ncbi:Bacterio-opsin activator HTH domain-containing protein [Halovivax asiaticus JCM 14624]|uniref:Bacterio-opsin activator HTH domain-containing protein n=1 Tax=Halovivax asiaticus JCM 14624 TaxID=1227490 RepID=M0BD37_9EURY|nr:bacterio-opsin activator domain-containing protein [Halovivax asiaticus]ELZ08218.1 Bacterio-opsin activator HTH domain-containing protein [Halovivax asiaticus JCM 14624]
MSVFLEFTIAKTAFTLGSVLAGSPPMSVELERIVPTGDSAMPFLWVTGDDFDAFERKVRGHEYVDDVIALDRVGDSTLYRVIWYETHNDLIRGITEADGTILEGRAQGRWHFRVRFPDHDSLSQFSDFCTDRDLPIEIVRTYTELEDAEGLVQYGLSDEQRDALLLGLRRGYFDTPSRTSLDDLADELEISQQATSDRIRRGTEQVLTEALLLTEEHEE